MWMKSEAGQPEQMDLLYSIGNCYQNPDKTP